MQETLSDLLEISLNAKQLHWTVKGAHFVGVHALLDELAHDLNEYIDEYAERMVYLGELPDGRPQIFIDDDLFVVDKRFYTGGEVCAWMAERLDDFSGSIDVRMVDLHEDPASQDILIRLQQTVDKYQWQFRVQV